eukprot:m.34344 g.34344  ORF g.34344 m.34344 type:complete len:646 (-) comp15453_c0_seq1:86-2023(-)
MSQSSNVYASTSVSAQSCSTSVSISSATAQTKLSSKTGSSSTSNQRAALVKHPTVILSPNKNPQQENDFASSLMSRISSRTLRQIAAEPLTGTQDSSEMNSFFSSLFQHPSLRETFSKTEPKQYQDGWIKSQAECSLSDHEFEQTRSAWGSLFEPPVATQPNPSLATTPVAPNNQPAPCRAPDPSQASMSDQNPYGLSFNFIHNATYNRTSTWAFGPASNQLFINIGVEVPLFLSTSKPIPAGTSVVLALRYIKPPQRHLAIFPCAVHQRLQQEQADPHPRHFLKCLHPQAQYCQDSDNFCFICVPASSDAEGKLCITLPLGVCCYSSCNGGISRRPIELIVALQSSTSTLASRRINVRACACPKRDCRTLENNQAKRKEAPFASQTGNNQTTSSSDLNTSTPIIKPKALPQTHTRTVENGSDVSSQHRTAKRRRITSLVRISSKRTTTMAPKQTYVLHIRGAENAQILGRIAQELDHVANTSVSSAAIDTPLNYFTSNQSSSRPPTVIAPSTPSSSLASLPTSSSSTSSSIVQSMPKETGPFDSFAGWLKSLELEEFQEKLEANGYDDLELLCHVTPQDLLELGITGRPLQRLCEAVLWLPGMIDSEKTHECLVDPVDRETHSMIRVTLMQPADDIRHNNTDGK